MISSSLAVGEEEEMSHEEHKSKRMAPHGPEWADEMRTCVTNSSTINEEM